MASNGNDAAAIVPTQQESADEDISEAKDSSESSDDEGAPEPAKKKRKGRKSDQPPRRTCDKQNSLLYSHFSDAGKDKSGNTTILCRHCLENYDKQMDLFLNNRASFQPNKVKAIRKRTKFAQSHLKDCRGYRTFMRKAKENGPISGFLGYLECDGSAPTAAVSTQQPQTPVSALSSGTGSKDIPKGQSKKELHGTLTDYFPMMFDMEQARIFNELVLEFIIDTHSPFNLVEQDSFHRVVNYLRSGSAESLVGRHALAGSRLNQRYKEAVARRDMSILGSLNGGHYGAFLVDGWEMANTKHCEGVILKLGSETFLLDALKGGSNHDGVSTARMWEEEIFFGDEGRKYKEHVKYFMTDEAGYCGRAKRILALRHPNILFGKCWAHQINLMVGHLWEISDYAEWVSKAITSASKVKKSSSKWYVRLQDTCDRLYGKNVASSILTLAETRWNSLQGCMGSLLRSRGACELLANEYKRDEEFLDALKVWADDLFWFKIEEGELLIRPFCDSSFLMQRDNNTLADVVFVILHLVTHLQDFMGSMEATQSVLLDIRKRWEDVEQPLYILAFGFHPFYRHLALDVLRKLEEKKGNWPNRDNKLCSRRLAHAAAKFYYDKFQLSMHAIDTKAYKQELIALEVSVYQWLNGEDFLGSQLFPYTQEAYPSVSDWFKVNESVLGAPFTRFAMFLLDAPVQAASCERLFKDFSRFHTKTRNRLGKEKLVKSTHIKYDLKKKYPLSLSIKKKKSLKAWENGHRNRFVTPEEHKRVDRDRNNNNNDPASNDRDRDATNTNADGTINVIEDVDESEEEEEARDVDVAALASLANKETDQQLNDDMRAILAALRSAATADDDDIMEDDDDSSTDGLLLETTTDGTRQTQQDVVDFDAFLARTRQEQQQQEEDPPERPPQRLDPLPTENVPSFPQENKQYFRGKRYVRKDKYAFEEILFSGLTLPPIQSTYKHKPIQADIE
jgi:hypothetical protein